MSDDKDNLLRRHLERPVTPIEVDVLVERILISEAPCVLASPDRCLSHHLAVDLAVSIASGTPFLSEFAIPERKRVLYLSAPTLRSGAARTFAKIAASKGIGVPGIPDLYAPLDALEIDEAGRCLLMDDLLDKSLAIVSDSSPLAVIVDSLSDTRGYESALCRFSAIVAACEGRMEVTPIIVHHTTARVPVRSRLKRSHVANTLPAQQFILANGSFPIISVSFDGTNRVEPITLSIDYETWDIVRNPLTTTLANNPAADLFYLILDLLRRTPLTREQIKRALKRNGSDVNSALQWGVDNGHIKSLPAPRRPVTVQ